jgi:hypothetical protein
VARIQQLNPQLRAKASRKRLYNEKSAKTGVLTHAGLASIPALSAGELVRLGMCPPPPPFGSFGVVRSPHKPNGGVVSGLEARAGSAVPDPDPAFGLAPGQPAPANGDPASGNPAGVRVDAVVSHKPVFLSGRYVKLSRELSQTPWFVDGQRLGEGSSLEEEITRTLLPFFKCRAAHKFHSSGREDIDVRMLGHGRLFFVELAEVRRLPRDPAVYTRMEQAVNFGSELVSINSLALSSAQAFAQAMHDIENKKKIYRSIVWTSRSLTAEDIARLNAVRDLTIQQKTPVRVLHRRSQLRRSRTIYKLHAEWLTPRFIQLDLTTQSGTYIKEFVHGDRGRTRPNLGELLGCAADILQLDVLQLLDA